MKLNDLKKWIEEVITAKMPDIKFKVFVGEPISSPIREIKDGKEVCGTDVSCQYHLIGLSSGGGSIMPPFTEYKRINVLVLSPHYLLDISTGNEDGDRVDRIINEVLDASGGIEGGCDDDLLTMDDIIGGGVSLGGVDPSHEIKDNSCEPIKLKPGESTWDSAEDLTRLIVEKAEYNYLPDEICFSSGALQPLTGVRRLPTKFDGRICFETTLQIII